MNPFPSNHLVAMCLRLTILLLVLACSTGSAVFGSPSSNETSEAVANKLTPEQQKEFVELVRELQPLLVEKKYAAAKPVLEKLLALRPDNVAFLYNLACIQSVLGDKKAAVANLEKAVENGWDQFQYLERDEDLDAIRREPGYRALVARKDEIQKQRAAKIHQKLVEKFGDDCLYRIDDKHRLVYATTVDQVTLDELDTTLSQYAEILGRELFTHKPERYVTVIIPKEWRDRQIGGLYNDPSAMLIAKGFGDTIIHEFIHALHYGDLAGNGQQHPIWVKEGLATLFEDSDLVDDKVQPEHNHRLNYIQKRAKIRRSMPWDKFLKLDQADFMRQPNYNYGQARYMFYYLYEQGQLGAWYHNYVATFPDDPTGAQAWVKTFGRELSEIEKDWTTWLMSLKDLPIRLAEGDASLGMSVRTTNEGLIVANFYPESGAREAGLKKDDLLIRLNDERVSASVDVLRVLNGHQVGDKIDVEYRRGTEYFKTTITLSPAPSPFRKKKSGRPKPNKET